MSEQTALPLGDSQREEPVVIAPLRPDYSIAIHITVQSHNLQLYLPARGDLYAQIGAYANTDQLSAIQRYWLRYRCIGRRRLLAIELLYRIDESLLPI